MKVKVDTGDSPLLLAQPHGGTEIPQTILERLNDTGRALADTDWHISRLYEDLVDNSTIVSNPP